MNEIASFEGFPIQASIADIIGQDNAMYMKWILLSSTILFLLVIYNNFLLNTKYDILTKYRIDTNELMIIPVVVLMIITAAYEGII